MEQFSEKDFESRQEYGYIYRVDVLDRGKYYIGQATFAKHGSFDPDYFGSGNIMRRYIQKNGTAALKLTKLASAYSRDELNRLEHDFIGDLYKTDPNCWNLIAGGSAVNQHSEESRVLMSRHMKGRKLNDEQRKRLSEAFKLAWSKKSPEERKHSKSHSEAISRALTGKHLSEKHRQALSHKRSRSWKQSIETKTKIGLSNSGKVYFTNGIIDVKRVECPEGFWRGRTNGKRTGRPQSDEARRKISMNHRSKKKN